jgi:CRP-like cAMP-binding protein
MDIEGLREIPLFRDVPDEMLNVLVPLVNEERFPSGSVIFDEGSVSDRFFIISEGEVEIRKRTDREEGGYKLIAVLQAGEFFGEMAVFLDEPRTASAVARTDVALVSMGRKDLLGMFSRSAEASLKTMGLLTSVLMDRLRNTTKELVAVYETGRLVTAARSMEELADCVLDGVLNALEHVDAGLFVLWNEFNADYEVYDQRGLDTVQGTPLDENDPVIRLLNEKKEPFVSFDLEDDPRFDLPEAAAYRGRSLVASPFLLQDRLLGFMLFINRSRPDAFSYNQMVLLSAVSGYISVAVENMRYMQAEVDRARLSRGKSTIQPF